MRADILQPGVWVFWGRPTSSGVLGREQEGFEIWGVNWICVALEKVVSSKCSKISKGLVMTISISHSFASDVLTEV